MYCFDKRRMLYRRTTKIIHLFNDRQPENPNPIFRLPFARHAHHDPTQNHPHRHGRILRIGRTAQTTPAARQARGGGLGSRSVICAASYEARKYGLRSAMAVATAKRLCPHAIFIPPQFALYRQVSQQIHQIFRLKPLQNPNGSLKLKMERRRLVAKLLIKYRITDFPRCRRAADVPLVTGFAKVSGCLWAMATVHKAINIKAA